MSTGHRTSKKIFDFNVATVADLDLRVQDSVVTSALAGGELVITAAAAGNCTIDLGGNGFAKADLLAIEAVMHLDIIDDDLDIRIGVSNTFNADPDVIAESAWFKIKGLAGAANAHSIFVETDDGTLDLNEKLTNKQVSLGMYQRFRIDFATGIQSVAPPNASKGGYGSVDFSCSRQSSGNPFMEHINPSEVGQHMDMDLCAGPLQPFIQVRLTGAPDATVTAKLKQICVEHRVY
jgi:hypothetical protein